MALVTFSVRTYGFGIFGPDEMMRVVFVPSGASTSTFSALPDRPEYYTPDADGLVKADLVPTLGLSPETWFKVRFKWFARDPLTGEWVLSGWSELPGELRVPEQGGTLGDLLTKSPPPGAYVWGFGPPPRAMNAIYVDLSGVVGGLYIPTGTVGI